MQLLYIVYKLPSCVRRVALNDYHLMFSRLTPPHTAGAFCRTAEHKILVVRLYLLAASVRCFPSLALVDFSQIV